MLGLFKKKESKPQNGLFLIGIKIGRGSNTEMPSQLVGAVVPAFASAANHELAAKAAVTALVAQGFEFLDIQGSIQQLDPQQWEGYVKSVWPEVVAHMPNQQAVLAGLNAGQVFFGPFAGYENA